MKNSLRYIIREQIQKIFEAEELSPEEQMLQDTKKQIEQSIDTLKQDIESSEKLLSTDRQAKGGAPSTISIGGKTIPNRKRKELEVGTDIEDKAIKAKQDYLKNLEKSRDEADKLSAKLTQDKAKQDAESKSEKSTLPSLSSPI
jgi:hypothetical protein